MRKLYIYLPIILFAVVLQTSSVPAIFESDWLPDILLMMIMAWSLIDGFEKFLPVSIAVGAFYDLAASFPLGLSSIVFVLAAYGVSFFSKRFSTDMKGTGILLSLFLVFFATIGSKLIYYYANWMAESGFLDGIMIILGMGKSFLWAFIWNFIYFLLWFFVINKVEDYFNLRTRSKVIVRT